MKLDKINIHILVGVLLVGHIVLNIINGTPDTITVGDIILLGIYFACRDIASK